MTLSGRAMCCCQQPEGCGISQQTDVSTAGRHGRLQALLWQAVTNQLLRLAGYSAVRRAGGRRQHLRRLFIKQRANYSKFSRDHITELILGTMAYSLVRETSIAATNSQPTCVVQAHRHFCCVFTSFLVLACSRSQHRPISCRKPHNENKVDLPALLMNPSGKFCSGSTV